MCGGPSPAPPDPYATASAQNQINSQAIQDTTKYNQVNQTSPFGASTWSGSYDDPNNPRTQNTTLNPQLQALLSGQTGIAQTLTDAAGNRLQGLAGMSNYQDPTTDMSLANGANSPLQTSYNTQGVPLLGAGANDPLMTSFAAPTTGTVSNVAGPQIQTSLGNQGQAQTSLGNQNFAQQITDAQNAAYGTQDRFVEQDFNRQQQSLEGQLAAQGIPQGSAAWNDAHTQLQNQRQEAEQSAQNAATTAGGSMQNQLFGQQLQAGQFANQGQQQNFEQALNAGDFGNQAQMLSFGAGMQNANLANTVNQQQFNQNLGSAQFNNQALGQQFNQGMDIMNYNQGAIGQNNQTNAAQAQFGNQASGQQFNQGMTLQNYNQGEQQRQIANRIQGRIQNFNEAASFLNGSPISPNNPTFQPTTQYTPAQAAPNYVSTAQNNYSTASAARSALLSSIFGAIGNVGGPWAAAGFPCWVARAVYGERNIRWVTFAHWMLNRAPKQLLAFYLEHGPAIADFIKDKPDVKLRLLEQMEAVLG